MGDWNGDYLGKFVRVLRADGCGKCGIASGSGFDQQRHFVGAFNRVLPVIDRTARCEDIDASGEARFDECLASASAAGWSGKLVRTRRVLMAWILLPQASGIFGRHFEHFEHLAS